MRSRRIACLLLGIWLSGSLFMTALAADSRRSADRIMDHHSPAASLRIKALGTEGSRLLLQYAAAEQTREWLEDWENFEMVFGAFFFLFLLFGTREGKFTLGVALAMALVAVCQRLITAPELIAASRLADFASLSSEETRLSTLEAGYAGIQVFEWLLGGILAAVLVTASRGGSEGIRQKP